ncbi:NAD(P)-binding protein [Lophium mytilinum]|uniref:NAD(P)-binding protein n=1 Tax=Lophium mytilinum TaxID=390894 RepID=A0A6A6QNM2_9PEZI|nr:NAD(P)-binding protein [Lophium mytilinum]
MSSSFPSAKSKTVIVTGGANGIGAQTVRTFHQNGSNVVIADLPFAKEAAEALISSLSDASRALYVPTNILNWSDMKLLYRQTVEQFGRVDIVIANAGAMESKDFYDLETDEDGDLKEPVEAYRIVDINLRGTMNSADGSRGSIVLIASTSGYFGGTSVVSYVASKHGVVGLFRASQKAADRWNVKLNVVAPFFTPTHITGSYAEKWNERGLPANTVEGVADAIIQTSTDGGKKGECILVAGKQIKEIELARTALVREWVGEDTANLMAEGGKFFDELGGYPLPKATRK